jgi:hypothetical protein
MALTTKYERLDPDERMRLWLAATARGDESERHHLLATAGESTVRMLNLGVADRMDALARAGAVARMALIGPVESAEMVARLLSPTPLWPEGFEKKGFPRPRILEQVVNLASGKATWTVEKQLDHSDDDEFDRVRLLGDAISTAAAAAVEELLSVALIGAFVRARTSVSGVAGWCDAVLVDSDDFLAYACADLLDRLDALKPAVDSAREVLRVQRDRWFTMRGKGDLPFHDPDHVDADSAAALAAMMRKYLPSLRAN